MIKLVIEVMSNETRSAAAPAITLEFLYRQSEQFRVVFADGVYGGVSPRGYLHCSFYSERGAIPSRTEMTVTEGLPEVERVVESPKGMIREVEVDVALDLPAAIAFHFWLGAKLEEFRARLQVSDADWRRLLDNVSANPGSSVD